MTEDKLLAEWFWVDRWDGSSAPLLPLEARGLYREMLSQAWRRGARLPNDHDAIQRAVRVTPEEWARCWPKIAPYWRETDGFLVNDTQIEVYTEAKGRQERASQRGRAGAQARAQASTQAHPERKPPSPSPSPNGNGSESVSVNGGNNGAPTYPLPPDEVTRSAIRGERWKHESELYKAVGEIAKRTGKEPGEVMAQVTAYKRGDGSIAPGRKRPELLRSDEAVEKSLADARAWLAQLEAKATA